MLHRIDLPMAYRLLSVAADCNEAKSARDTGTSASIACNYIARRNQGHCRASLPACIVSMNGTRRRIIFVRATERFPSRNQSASRGEDSTSEYDTLLHGSRALRLTRALFRAHCK